MTKTYAALRLLQLGPLALREFVEITGWPYKTCRKTLSWLQQTGRVINQCGEWRLG